MEETWPTPSAGPATVAEPKRPFYKKKRWWAVAVAAILVVAAASGSGSTKEEAGDGSSSTVASTAQDNVESSLPAEESAPAATAAPDTVPAETDPAAVPVTSAAPDASPYVTAFGDVSVISLPDGDPGVLTIIASAAVLDDSGSLPVVVRNNTANPIGQIEVTGIARDASGALAGSGSSQGFQPRLVQPGEIAWGYVYFSFDIKGEGLTFELSVNSEEPDTYFVPVEITEVNAMGDQIIGILTNTSDATVSGPISVGGICFNADGGLGGTIRAFGEQDELAVGSTGSFAIDLYGDPCPIGLIGASGYNM